MNKYPLEFIGADQEPVLAHISERERELTEPSEDELRYLGNAWNYCGYFHKDLDDCVREGIRGQDNYLLKKCKNKLESLHHCYSWREPTEYEYQGAYFAETKQCDLYRDTFLKCYFRQVEPWATCHPIWMETYRCLFRKDPDKYTVF